MEEKYIAMIFEKTIFDLDEGLCLFTPVEVIDGNLDMEDDSFLSKTNREYISMDDIEFFFSEDKYCYGYPIEANEFKKMYPETPEDKIIGDILNPNRKVCAMTEEHKRRLKVERGK